MDIFLSCLYSFLATIGFCIIFNIRGKMVFFASLGGALGWLGYELSVFLGNDLSQYFVATIIIALYSEIMARLHKVPVTVYLIPALIPVVPGGGIYYTMEHFLNGNIDDFLSQFVHTIAIAGCLAFGILLVSSLVRLTNRIKLYNNKRKVAR
ncbi:MAG: threonine/serine exporter family protein [Turicibacter sp.]|nr:threonine/serine exporter family protein [Turicibacter sp.]